MSGERKRKLMNDGAKDLVFNARPQDESPMNSTNASENVPIYGIDRLETDTPPPFQGNGISESMNIMKSDEGDGRNWLGLVSRGASSPSSVVPPRPPVDPEDKNDAKKGDISSSHKGPSHRNGVIRGSKRFTPLVDSLISQVRASSPRTRAAAARESQSLPPPPDYSATSSKLNSDSSSTEKTIVLQALRDGIKLSSHSIQVIVAATNEGVPVATSIQEFQEKPNELQPQPVYINGYHDDETFLTFCIRNGQHEAALMLLKYGADPNKFNKKQVLPIASAANKGMLDTMQHLIDFGADVNLVNGNNGSTALIQAAHFGHHEGVVLLLKNGADADVVNKNGTTALMRASQEGHMDIAHALISGGAHVRRSNKEGMTALMLASQRGHKNMITLLAKAGAELDSCTSLGSSALMLAAKRGETGCITELVRLGAEIHVLDDSSRTAWDHAKRKNFPKLLPFLDTQAQLRSMASSIRLMRNNMMLSLLIAHRNGHLELKPQFAYAHSLYEYLRKWRVSTSSTANSDPVLDMTALKTAVQPQLHNCYVGFSHDDEESIQFKATMSILRCLQRDDPTVHDSYKAYIAASALFDNDDIPNSPESITVHDRENYEGLRRHLGAFGLAPSEAHSLLKRGQDMDKFLRIDRHWLSPSGGLRLQKAVSAHHGHMWSILFMRCMNRFPTEIVRVIISFLPAPRLWSWSLKRAKTRMKVAPSVVMRDLFIMIDEIFCDSQLFHRYTKDTSSKKVIAQNKREIPCAPGGACIQVVGLSNMTAVSRDECSSTHAMDADTETGGGDGMSLASLKSAVSVLSDTDRDDNEMCDDPVPPLSPKALHTAKSTMFRDSHKHKHVLISIAHTPLLQQYLVDCCDMPIALVQNCVYWSDMQSKFTDSGSADDNKESHTNATLPCVKSLWLFVKALHKWSKHRDNLLSSLEIPDVPEGPSVVNPTKYDPFMKIAVQAPQLETMSSHPIVLLNEGVGASVNFLMESACLKVNSRAFQNNAATPTWFVNNGNINPSRTGYHDRGIPGVNYAAEYDSDDSADSANNYISGADEDTGGEEENDGDGVDDSSAGHTTTTMTLTHMGPIGNVGPAHVVI